MILDVRTAWSPSLNLRKNSKGASVIDWFQQNSFQLTCAIFFFFFNIFNDKFSLIVTVDVSRLIIEK